MNLYIYEFATFYYCFGIVMMVLVPLLSGNLFISHGKTLKGPNNESTNRYNFVTKRAFGLFYFIGIVGMLIDFAYFSAPTILKGSILIHLLKRLIECFIFKYSKHSKMHLIHFFVGISYYPFLIISLSREGGYGDLCFMLIFTFISILQCYCHYLLWKVRGDSYSPVAKIFPIPFSLVLCPHYSLEIVLYFLIMVWSGFRRLLLLNFLFTLINLGIGATNTGKWYMKYFKISKMQKLLIPFIY